MAHLTESCNVCQKTFDVVFRYQMEERDGGFAFFCSRDCLTANQEARGGGTGTVACDACARHFTVKLAAHVLYAGGRRRHACSMACRSQIVREATGTRLGEIAAHAAAPPPEIEAPPEMETQRRPSRGPAVAVPLVPAASPQRRANDGPHAAKISVASPRAAKISVASPRAAKPGVAAPEPSTSGPRRIAVFNHKGGTGKTTTSVSLAAGLAAAGKKVLLVDTDSQGNVAVSLGAKCERSLYHVLVMGLRVSDATQRVRENLDLLPSNETLAAAELYLAGRKNRDRVLSQRMASALDRYDYVIVDCSPSLSLMNQNALCLADSVLVPVACDYLSLVGVRQVIKTVKNVNQLLRHRLQIWGVLPTMYDGRAKICAEALATLQSHFGERCLRPIRATTKLKEAPAQATSIFEHAPGSHGDEDYRALVQCVLDASAQKPTAHVSPARSAAERAVAAF